MVLHHVAERAGVIIVRPAAFDAERLAGGDLHVIDVTMIPERLEDAIGEAQDHDVLRGFLAEEVINAEGVFFREGIRDDGVELRSGGEVVAEGFLDDDPGPAAGGGFVELEVLEVFQDSLELGRRDGEIKEAIAAGAELGIDIGKALGERLVALGIAELAAMRKDAACEALPALILDALTGEFPGVIAELGAELLVRFIAPGEADDGERGGEIAIGGKVVKGRDELALGEIASGAKDNHRARLRHRTAGETLAEGIGLFGSFRCHSGFERGENGEGVQCNSARVRAKMKAFDLNFTIA
jgi:hypothetical protein